MSPSGPLYEGKCLLPGFLCRWSRYFRKWRPSRRWNITVERCLSLPFSLAVIFCPRLSLRLKKEYRCYFFLRAMERAKDLVDAVPKLQSVATRSSKNIEKRTLNPALTEPWWLSGFVYLSQYVVLYAVWTPSSVILNDSIGRVVVCNCATTDSILGSSKIAVLYGKCVFRSRMGTWVLALAMFLARLPGKVSWPSMLSGKNSLWNGTPSLSNCSGF